MKHFIFSMCTAIMHQDLQYQLLYQQTFFTQGNQEDFLWFGGTCKSKIYKVYIGFRFDFIFF